MEQEDIRWQQRFSNFIKALNKLSLAVNYINENNDSNEILEEIVKEGLIQRFEYTHELAWNTMKDYAEYQGNFDIRGSRDATREAFKMQLITNGTAWMDMISSRNKTSHTYNELTAEEVCDKIINEYFDCFSSFSIKMEELRTGTQTNLF